MVKDGPGIRDILDDHIPVLVFPLPPLLYLCVLLIELAMLHNTSTWTTIRLERVDSRTSTQSPYSRLLTEISMFSLLTNPHSPIPHPLLHTIT